MAGDFKIVTMETLSGGAVVERLNHVLQEVLTNIDDPNTNPTIIREVNLKLKIKPNVDRTTGVVDLDVWPKLAHVSEHHTQIYFGKTVDGKGEISEVQEAPTLFDDMDNNGTKITPITAKKEGTNNA